MYNGVLLRKEMEHGPTVTDLIIAAFSQKIVKHIS